MISRRSSSTSWLVPRARSTSPSRRSTRTPSRRPSSMPAGVAFGSTSSSSRTTSEATSSGRRPSCPSPRRRDGGGRVAPGPVARRRDRPRRQPEDPGRAASLGHRGQGRLQPQDLPPEVHPARLRGQGDADLGAPSGSANFTWTDTHVNLNNVVHLPQRLHLPAVPHRGRAAEARQLRPRACMVPSRRRMTCAGVPVRVLFAPDHTPELEIVKQLLKGAQGVLLRHLHLRGVVGYRRRDAGAGPRWDDHQGRARILGRRPRAGPLRSGSSTPTSSCSCQAGRGLRQRSGSSITS